MKETVEERMIRVVFEDGKSFGLVGDSPLDPIYIRKTDTEPIPNKYTINYGDGDFEEFYALDEQQVFLFSYALATEHYWFYDRKEIEDMFENKTIQVMKEVLR